ncbi:hypothetical protein HCN44_006206 [Aphidius gifuensis]|uniref:SET domain-containing protein n=1 Tax=Aphidius gifuensis TaxID=684658 RepID=A0A834Y1K4_APHGI|nr:hypothetical protein HCN44_006206 [Aphidius gifuensis]
MSEEKNSVESVGETFKILQNDQVGKYMVADKDLEPGDVIVSEKPFIVGPKSSTYPLCLSCYTPWPPTEDSQPLCSKCGWPVCGEECGNAPQHCDYECSIFANAREKFNVTEILEGTYENGIPHFECITPLRLLLASEKYPDKWNNEIKNKESHNEKRSTKNQWKTDHVNIVTFIRDRLKLDRFTENDIQTACGILEINTHEVRTKSGYSARALYPTVALTNHSCVSNTNHSVYPDDYKIVLRASVKIPKGSEIYGSYVSSLLPTLLRREQLLEGKHFSCACNRCSDPTELGTHLSSLKCSKCDNGIVITLDSLDPESIWKCTHCEFTTSAAAVKKVFTIINNEIDNVEMITMAHGPEAIQAREQVIKKYHSVLHPRHAFLVMLKYSLVQLYGRVDEYMLDDLPDIILEHKVEMCHLILQVLNSVEPGYTRMRGLTLYELHAPLLFIAKSQWNAGVIDNDGLKPKMIEAANILKEAATILSLEPEDTPEGQIGISYYFLNVQTNCFIMKIEEIFNISKYKESHSEKYGRYLIAAKKLLPGEVILRDNPIAIGPAVFNSNSLCFACIRVIPRIDIIDFKYLCNDCGVAFFCSSSCKERKNHHTTEECELFKLKNSKKVLSQMTIHETRSILLFLRLYLVKKRDPSVWNKILKLEGHLETRRDTKIWFESQNNEDEELLQKICGIIDVNSFELRSPGTLDESPLRGLYTEASLMAHDCRGNTHITVDDDFQLTVYASCPIDEGQGIFYHYTSALLGVVDRREYLREGKYFDCECKLCSDPSELGTNLSSIKCPCCKIGLIQLKKLIKNPYDKDKTWQCSKCLKYYSGNLENLLNKLSFTYHSNHFIMINLKQKLLMNYRMELISLNPQKKILKRMLELYEDILDVHEIIEPGISRLKGIILYEMHLPIEILADRDYMSGEITPDELSKRLQKSMDLLKKSLSMLLLEPSTNPEGLLAKKALEQYKNIRDKIEDVKALARVDKLNQ